MPLPDRLLLALGRFLASLPTPRAMALLHPLAGLLPTSADAEWSGAARKRLWRLRGEAQWAARRSPVDLCKSLRFEGWEHLHEATAAGRPVLFVGLRPAGWEFALLALGRCGMPVTLATCDGEDEFLAEEHRRVGNAMVNDALVNDVLVPHALPQSSSPVCVAFLGSGGKQGQVTEPCSLEVAVDRGAAFLPLFARRERGGWCLTLRQSAGFDGGDGEKTTSKKEQALQWVHRICMQAVDAEARRLPDDWSWQTRSSKDPSRSF